MKTNIHLWPYLSQFFLKKTKAVENIKTHILCSITFWFFFEIFTFHEIIWKNILEQGRPQMTIWRMCIACWKLKKTKHKLRISDTYWFCTATMVAQLHFNYNIYVHCVSSYVFLPSLSVYYIVSDLYNNSYLYIYIYIYKIYRNSYLYIYIYIYI